MFQHQSSNRKSTNGRIRFIQNVMRFASHLAPKTTARLAQKVFVTPMVAAGPEREKVWATDSKRAVIPCAAGPIPIWTWGRGQKTVLLAHGWAGRGLQLGAFVKPLVARGYRVVTHDAPGHGEAGGRTSSMIKFAAAIGAVSRHFGEVSAVIAHSLGATASIYALAQKELDAERLVLIAPSGDLRAMCGRFGEMTGFSSEVVDHMRKRFETGLGFDWENSEPLHIARGASAPALVIHDRDDRFIPHAESEALAETWPSARLLTTEGLGHHRILRDTNIVKAAVDFVTPSAEETSISRGAVDHGQRERKAS